MWSKTKTGIVIFSKVDDIKADNVFVVETNEIYYMIGLTKIPNVPIRTWGSEEHPLAEMAEFMRNTNDKNWNCFTIVDGIKTTIAQAKPNPLCHVCNNKFKGLTGTCGIHKYGGEEQCSFNTQITNPPVLMTTGAFIDSKYIDKNYRFYKRGRSMGTYMFSLPLVEKNCEEIIANRRPLDRGAPITPAIATKMDDNFFSIIRECGKEVSYKNETHTIGFPLPNGKVVIWKGDEFKIIDASWFITLTRDTQSHRFMDLYSYLMSKVDIDTMNLAEVGQLKYVSHLSNSDWYGYNYGRLGLVLTMKTPKMTYESFIRTKEQIRDICAVGRGLTNYDGADIL